MLLKRKRSEIIYSVVFSAANDISPATVIKTKDKY